MSRSLWLRFFAISIFFALLLSLFYLWMIREVTTRPGDEVQRSMYLFIARIVEEHDYAEGLRRVQAYRSESPAIPLKMWIVNSDNKILASNPVDAPPPAALLQRIKPGVIHEVVARGRFFSGSAATAIVRLQADEPRYLLIHNPGTAARGAFFTMATLFVVTLVTAILLGLLLLALYLRGRSAEARDVIKSMEAGNLGARFTSGRLDAIGGLMQHFNAMADEIQRLVMQLQAIEKTRRELLQELGHDLRTPLTSLRTAIDTLSAHGEAMEMQEREEFFTVVSCELDYFTRLIDDLFFIANIDEPRYRNQATSVDLCDLLKIETDHADHLQQQADQAIEFALQIDATCDQGGEPGGSITGDTYLMSRLLRNVFDNAARYAHSKVRIRLSVIADALELIIEDDGPGLSADAMFRFGQRRDTRLLFSGLPSKQAEISLGLGSVIIKAIVELHGGHYDIGNGETHSEYPGARLSLIFPRR
ncbi:HAMP domain-containing sensor histidine kinase [Undibacterium umbellatum]|uniref:histidine kinase n=1 Tax=Undibacterium umbellatum TaxID=2762300 RepID=A0ABR6ZAA3_9BURK|nr:HAMP domain-containing sensor histidine kinase [Undibacterium umbellatum]MBC3908603.1 HAMP domain-containing histidine kinase [Undibacterium umbellatum]